MSFIETDEELDSLVIDNIIPFSFTGEVHLAKVIKCIDGDTVHCLFKHNDKYYRFTLRMLGYNSPELHPRKTIPENERNIIITKANNAKKRLEELLLNKNVYVFCNDFDSFGRILAEVKLDINSDISINKIMLSEGHGVIYE